MYKRPLCVVFRRGNQKSTMEESLTRPWRSRKTDLCSDSSSVSYQQVSQPLSLTSLIANVDNNIHTERLKGENVPKATSLGAESFLHSRCSLNVSSHLPSYPVLSCMLDTGPWGK